MVGLVIVSHSEKIADGIKELAIWRTGFFRSIESAGGTVDGMLGTSTAKIRQAIENVDQGDGVVIVADLGSAVMSAAMVIELAGEHCRGKVKIADAPVLEGAMAAACLLAGKSFSEVLAAAERIKILMKK